MNSREAMRAWVERWRLAGPELERVRQSELRAVDTVAAVSGLDGLAWVLREHLPAPSSGLVEQQRWFQLLRQ